MRLGEDDRAGNAATLKLVEQVSDYGQTRFDDSVEAKLTQQRRVSEKPRIPFAAVQVGDKMETLQFA